MKTLRELQTDFLGALYAAKNQPPADIRREPHDISRRFEVYRQSLRSNFLNALKADFPVVARLVGEDFFRFACAKYIAGRPSHSADLNLVGHGFAAFLSRFPSASALPYLPDVARFEWLWQNAFLAEDTENTLYAQLETLDPAQYGDLRFVFHPSHRIFDSPYPVLSIWQANQPHIAEPPTVSIDEGATRVELYRPATTVEIRPLTQSEYRFVESLRHGRTLDEAGAECLARDPEFAVDAALHDLLSRGTVVRLVDGGENAGLHRSTDDQEVYS